MIKLTDAPQRANADLGRTALDNDALGERYRKEISRQLLSIGIDRPYTLCGRGRISIGNRRIVGYSVRVSSLDPPESIALQGNGLGGKRGMGCGIFRPTRGGNE